MNEQTEIPKTIEEISKELAKVKFFTSGLSDVAIRDYYYQYKTTGKFY